MCVLLNKYRALERSVISVESQTGRVAVGPYSSGPSDGLFKHYTVSLKH